MLLAQIRANWGKILFGKQPRKMAKFDLEQKFSGCGWFLEAITNYNLLS